MRQEGLSLPPTPEDIERVELVLRELSQLRTSTDAIMSLVADHAFAGFTRAAALSLSRHLTEAAALCRRCEHGLNRCNPRAAMAIEDEERRNIAFEMRQAADHYVQVATAARSVLRQVPRSGGGQPLREGGQGGEWAARGPVGVHQPEQVANAWSELFELPSPAPAPPAAAPLSSAAAFDAATFSPPRRPGESAGDVGSSVAPSSVHGSVPGAPTVPATQGGPSSPLSPSAPLSLWKARQTTPGLASVTPCVLTPCALGSEDESTRAVDGFDALALSTASRTPAAAASASACANGSRLQPRGAVSTNGHGLDVPSPMGASGVGTDLTMAEGDQTTQRAMALNDELIEERSGALKAVAAEVHALNELFVELGHVVAVQGHGVHEAAGLAHDVYDDVAAAKEELEQAERDQFKGCTLS